MRSGVIEALLQFGRDVTQRSPAQRILSSSVRVRRTGTAGRASVEHLSNIGRTSVEHRSSIDRPSVDRLSIVDQVSADRQPRKRPQAPAAIASDIAIALTCAAASTSGSTSSASQKKSRRASVGCSQLSTSARCWPSGPLRSASAGRDVVGQPEFVDQMGQRHAGQHVQQREQADQERGIARHRALSGLDSISIVRARTIAVRASNACRPDSTAAVTSTRPSQRDSFR